MAGRSKAGEACPSEESHRYFQRLLSCRGAGILIQTRSSDATVTALVDALIDDPFYIAVSMDDAGRVNRETLYGYFACSLDEGRQTGKCVILDDAAAGAAIWSMPVDATIAAEAARLKHEILRTTLSPRGMTNYLDIVKFMKPRAQAVVREDDWYLSIIGVSPNAQGRGVGAALLAPTLKEADLAGAACYLETFGTRAARFYERLGFETLAKHREPVTGEEYLVMRRSTLTT